MKRYGLFLLFALVTMVGFSAGPSDARETNHAFYQAVLEDTDAVLALSPDFEAPVVLTVSSPELTPQRPTASALREGSVKDVVQRIRGPTGRSNKSGNWQAHYSYPVLT